ncbi:MAG: sulfite exporter TauE/SafE family protein [Clostridia bacterium]
MFEIFICIIAGIGAGLGTGFAGMSAAVVISPMLITFLGMDAYTAIGIALASDVLASAVSSYTYARNKNIDIKNGLTMMVPVLICTLVGSLVSSLVSTSSMGNLSLFTTAFLGLKFIISPVMTTKTQMEEKSAKTRFIQSVIAGIAIGIVCGFIGAGGGMMMLLIFTLVLGYELKTAVGTSVFIMTFTAFTGAVSHFVIGDLPNWTYLIVCCLSTLIFARIAAVLANKISAKVLNRSMGVLLTVMGFGMIIFNYVFN